MKLSTNKSFDHLKVWFCALFLLTIFASSLNSSIALGETQIFLTGPYQAGPILANEDGRFAFENVPLMKNAINKFIVRAVDDNGYFAEKEVVITQVSLDSIVVSKVTTERLSVEEVEKLVNDGVIDLDDPANYNVSSFNIVLTIKNEPVRISVPIPIPKNQPNGFERIRFK
ncbi:MAG TPA: hypothetical protein ENG16_02075, partial [Archaeoglobus sp.]|nr:hypothetical protein [Archaeoglobus sp.]